MVSKARKGKLPKKGVVATPDFSRTPEGRIRKAIQDKAQLTRSTPVNGLKKAHTANSVRAQQFGQLLLGAMLAKGMRQIQLSEQLKIPKDSISGYCNGQNIPSDERLKQIAEALDVKPEELLPNFGTSGVASSNWSVVYDHDGKTAWIQLNRRISATLASEIQAMISKEIAAEDAAKGKRSKT